MVDQLDITSGATVIDVGTGTGVFLPYLLQKTGSNGKIIALDIAERMLLKAKSKFIAGNIEFVCSDVAALPFPDESCDALVCYSCLPHFSDKLRAMWEMKRILKRSGRIFICHTSSREHINSIHKGIPSMRDHLLPDAIEMMEIFTKAGFTGIRVEDKKDSYFAYAVKNA